jgi:hypothetical protein
VNYYILASNASATGAAVDICGGTYVFIASGNVGGSTIRLQVQQPDGFWCDVFDASVEATELPYVLKVIELRAGNVRASTAGDGVWLNASLVRLG